MLYTFLVDLTELTIHCVVHVINIIKSPWHHMAYCNVMMLIIKSPWHHMAYCNVMMSIMTLQKAI